MTSRLFVLLGVLVLTVGAVAYNGDGNPASTTEDRIGALEAKVASLEKRIARLEQPVFVKRQSQAQKPTDTDIGDWRNLSNWSKIKQGMSKAQVIRLLGESTRRSLGGKLLHWEGYVDEAGSKVSGNVFFPFNKASLIEPPVW